MAGARYTEPRVVRFTPDLARRIRIEARDDHVNESEMIRSLLEEALDTRHQKHSP